MRSGGNLERRGDKIIGKLQDDKLFEKEARWYDLDWSDSNPWVWDSAALAKGQL